MEGAAMRMLPLAVLVLMAFSAAAQEQVSVEEFIREAAQDDIADVEIGRMARTDPSTPQVVQDVGQALTQSAMERNDRLSKLAAGHGVAVANQIEPQDRTAIRELSKVTGEAFTRRYLEYFMGDLEGDLRSYRKVAESNAPPDVKDFAQQAIPKLEQDLALVRKVWEEQVAEGQ
jgi:putative membrane protein